MRVLRWVSRFWTGVLAVVALGCLLLLGLRMLLPLLPLASRPLLATAPANGVLERAPQQPITLTFSTPMNPRSVEKALRLVPPTPLSFAWNSDSTNLSLTPLNGFTPATSYTLTLEPGAVGRWYQPLDQASSRTIAFQIAPAPEAFTLFPLPDSQAVSLNTALSIGFSRPMVDVEQFGQSQPQPLLQFEPPLEAMAIWVDAATLLVQPRTPLRPATRYTAILDPNLADMQGIRLGQQVRWSFATAAPTLLSLSPADGASAVAPSMPLVLRFSQPFDQAAVAATLAISPTVAGRIASATLPDATGVVTFTPEPGWATDTRYQVTLPPGLFPLEGNLPLAGVQASFQSAPQPVITGRFPGAGQVLPPGQALRLIFNTPIDPAALETALRFEPPVTDLQLAVNGNIAQISAAFAPATVYTATLTPDLTDLNGVALGQAYQLRFQSAAAPPTLLLPEAEGNILRLAAGQRGPLLQRANLTALTASVYPLDADTAVRLLAFSQANWRDFDAERSGLTALRTFTRSFTDTLNATISEPLVLTDTGTLDPGAYYLRLRGSDNLRADTLVFVGSTTLNIRAGIRETIVWATDQAGVPRAGVGLSLYRAGTLAERGQTDANGLWRISGAQTAAASLVALSSDGGVATTEAPGQAEPPPYAAVLFSDAATYQAGTAVQVAGVVRPAGVTLPAGGLIGTLALRNRASGEQVANQLVQIASDGVISASLTLPRATLPGNYVLSLGLGNQVFTRDIAVAAVGPPATATIDAPTVLIAGTALTATVQAIRSNVPLASATVSWTLSFEPLPPPNTFSYGTPPTLAAERRGIGTLDANGQTLVLSDTLPIDQPLRYTLSAQIARGDVLPLQASASGTLLPAGVAVAANASQIAAVGQPFDLALLTENGAGAAGDVAIEVALERLPNGDLSQPAVREQTRTIRSDPTGRAIVSITPTTAGLHQIVARVADEQGRTAQVVLPLWVTADGFDWPAPTTGVLPLVSDRARYQPGDIATLLIPAATKPGAALVTVRRGNQLSAEVQRIQAGGLITVPIGLDRSLLAFEVLLGGQTSAAPLLATTTLAVATPPALQLTLASNQPTGIATTLVFSTTNGSGEPRPATVAVAIADATGRLVLWRPQVQIGATGVLSLPVPLPSERGPLTVRAQAVDDAGNSASATQTLANTQPLEVSLDMPPLLRIGDVVELQARLRNRSDTAQQATVRFAASGLTLLGDATGSASIAPRATAVITVQAQANVASMAQASVVAQRAGQQARTAQASAAISLAIAAPANRGGLADPSWSSSFAQVPNQPLVLSVAPSVAALARDEISRLAAQPARSASDNAALLHLTAPLTSEQTLAQEALTSLLRAESPGGGWAWQGSEADADLSLFAFEGLIAARKAGLVVPDSVVQRTLALFNRESGPAASARLAYATAISGGNTALVDAASRALQALSASDLALLLVARPAQSSDAALIDALLARLRSDERGSYVASNGLGGDLAATALVARALAATRPTAPALAELRRFLVSRLGPEGWPNSLIAARAIAALGNIPAARTYSTALNNSVLAVPSGTPITTTQRLVVPPSELRASNRLTVAASGGVALASFAYGPVNIPATSELALFREYLDPQTGAALDLTQLRVGQLVRVRLTVISRESLRYLVLHEPIPAGCIVVETGQTPFASEAGSRQISFQRALLEPGVYQQSYTAQIANAGRFIAPALEATTSGGTVLGQSQAAVLHVAR